MIYHTGKERRIIGVAEVVSKSYADPTLDDVKRVVVDVRAVKKVSQIVTLAQIKQDTNLENFDLVRIPRLSVVSVPELYWQRILELAQKKKN